MTAPAYTMDVAARPLGQHYGGKFGISIACPECGKPALLFKRGRTQGVYWTEYAHRFSLDLDYKHEPRMTASQICRRSDDPSSKRKKGSK